jgi:anti-anti-sigma regulatory factor
MVDNDPAALCQVIRYHTAGITVIELYGEIDLTGLSALLRQECGAAAEPHPQVVIDVTHASFLDGPLL